MLTPETQILTILKRGVFPGSWLIIGPYGVGKTTFAKRLCALLLTGDWEKDISTNPDVKWIERGLTDDAKKDIQKTILAGKAVLENEKNTARKSAITIDEIREGLQFLSFKSSATSKRILVIDLADEMNTAAANALLKALEEPPENTIILLLCENTGKLLPTICSRCRKITLRPLTMEKLTLKIKELIKNCPDPELLAELSNGSIGMALKINETDGINLYQKINQFLTTAMKIDLEKLNAFADILNKKDDQYFLFKYFVLNWVTRESITRAGHDPKTALALIELHKELSQLFADVDNLHLDKKQAIINTFLKIGGAL